MLSAFARGGLTLFLVAWAHLACAQSNIIGGGIFGDVKKASSGSPMTTPMMTSMPATGPSTTVAQYNGIGGGSWGGAENRLGPIAIPGTVTGIAVSVPTAVVANQWTFTLRKNSTTVLSCVISSGTTCSVTGSVSIATTDQIGWQSCPGTVSGNTCTPGSAPTTEASVSLSFTFLGTNNGEGFVAWGSYLGQNPSTSAVAWLGIANVPLTGTSNDSTVSSVMPTAGTIDNLFVQGSAAPGASAQWTATLFHNGSFAGVSCVIGPSASTKTCDSSSQSTNTPITIAAGDTVSIQWCPGTVSAGTCTPGTAPASLSYGGSFRWKPTTSGQAIVMSNGGSNQPATSGNNYFSLASGSVNNSETGILSVAPANMHIKSLYWSLSTAPGGAVTRSASLRENSAAPGSPVNCTIGSAATFCQDITTNYSATQGDVYDWQTAITGGTPAGVTWAKFGAVVTVP